MAETYEYRAKYNAYKKQRMEEERKKAACPQLDGQMMMEVSQWENTQSAGCGL